MNALYLVVGKTVVWGSIALLVGLGFSYTYFGVVEQCDRSRLIRHRFLAEDLLYRISDFWKNDVVGIVVASFFATILAPLGFLEIGVRLALKRLRKPVSPAVA